MVNQKHHDLAAFQMLCFSVFNFYFLQAEIFRLKNGFMICFFNQDFNHFINNFPFTTLFNTSWMKKELLCKIILLSTRKTYFFKCLTLHISKTKLILWLKWNKRLLDNKSWEPLDTILSCKWGIQVFDAGILVWVLKLYAQINEKQLRKISLIQILEDKIFIVFVSKHSKKFNFTMSLFF